MIMIAAVYLEPLTPSHRPLMAMWRKPAVVRSSHGQEAAGSAAPTTHSSVTTSTCTARAREHSARREGRGLLYHGQPGDGQIGRRHDQSASTAEHQFFLSTAYIELRPPSVFSSDYTCRSASTRTSQHFFLLLSKFSGFSLF